MMRRTAMTMMIVITKMMMVIKGKKSFQPKRMLEIFTFSAFYKNVGTIYILLIKLSELSVY